MLVGPCEGVEDGRHRWSVGGIVRTLRLSSEERERRGLVVANAWWAMAGGWRRHWCSSRCPPSPPPPTRPLFIFYPCTVPLYFITLASYRSMLAARQRRGSVGHAQVSSSPQLSSALLHPPLCLAISVSMSAPFPVSVCARVRSCIVGGCLSGRRVLWESVCTRGV